MTTIELISRSVLTFVLNALWQLPLLALTAGLISRILRKSPASYRHAVWALALVAGLLLPFSSVEIHARRSAPTVRYVLPDEGDARSLPAQPVSASKDVGPAKTTRTVPVTQAAAIGLAFAYLLFVVVRVIVLGRAWSTTVRIRRSAKRRARTEMLDRIWQRCCQTFNLSNVELLSSTCISSPVAAGVIRPVVILPEALFAESSEDVLATAVGHEMAHIARRDFALRLLYEFCYLPLSFHPAARIICRGIERTREMACDELATSRIIDSGAYANSIMKIAAGITETRVPGYTLGVFDGDILEERIRRLIHPPTFSLGRSRLLLAGGFSALAICCILASGLAISARAQSGTTAEIKLAGEAYNSGDFKIAVQHFDNAAHLDPTNAAIKLFLANALMREFFEEKGQADSPLMVKARQQYLDVLATDPHNKAAVQGVIAVAMDTKRWDEARDWSLKFIQLASQDKNSYYTLGVVDWSAAFPMFLQTQKATGVPMHIYYISDDAARSKLRDGIQPNIEEGLRMLQKSLELDPGFDDAMAYTNLMYRLKAAIASTPSEAADYIATADMWVGKALSTKKQHGAKPPADTKIAVDGPPPGPASPKAVLAGPPPPPPPPSRPASKPVPFPRQ